MRNPPITWSITSLVNEERDVVHRLYEEAFPGQDSALDTLGDMAEVLVARSDGVIIGYLVATVADDRVELWEHIVSQGHRARGVGRDLLAELARHLPGDDLVVVDPAKLLDSDRLEDYYGHAGFRLASTGEMQARVVEVSAALAEAWFFPERSNTGRVLGRLGERRATVGAWANSVVLNVTGTCSSSPSIDRSG